jgi:23S rRNA pseudouridine2605 synthase
MREALNQYLQDMLQDMQKKMAQSGSMGNLDMSALQNTINPEDLQSFHAVGRLDMHTTGLLLLTNDTRLSSFLTEPGNAIPRTYVVRVEGEFTEGDEVRVLKGVQDGGDVLKAVEVKIKKRSGKESILLLTLTEGKNREIRRLCLALGHEVRDLKRIRFGHYELGELAPGELCEGNINSTPDMPASGFGKSQNSEG